MTTLAQVTITASPWLWPIILATLLAAALTVWSYRRSPHLDPLCRLAQILKIVGLILLAACLLEPLYMGRRVETDANHLAVVLDNSATMSVTDLREDKPRAAIAIDLLTGDRSQWLAEVDHTFRLERYTFDSTLRQTADFSELAFDGHSTSMAAALRALADRYQDKPLAGIILLTDGAAIDLGPQPPDLSALPPIYPVPVAGRRPPRDLSLTNISVTQTSFEDAPITIQADVHAAGFENTEVHVRVIDPNSSQIETHAWSIKKPDEKQVFRFELKPERTGVLFYDVEIAEDPVEPNDPSRSDEATIHNNKRTVVVDRGEGPYRILYVSGRPNWEFKFLKRAVYDDKQIQLVGLIRVAKREPKYDWRGRGGEQTNPLFRGFDDQDQDEQYDQPVMVRLNTRDDAELADGFPKSPEDLFCYHAVILDDVNREFFTQDQMDLLRRFVSERGGGFLMLGGAESFRSGDFDRTPIGSILPVHLDRLPAEVPETALRLDLTREGWLLPWARLRDNELEEQVRLDLMPPFKVLNRIAAVKAGARIVATVGDPAEPFPAMVVHRYGNGRAAALTIGDIWRWGLQNPELHEDMDKFWRQTLRWLIADVPEPVNIKAVTRTDLPNQPVELEVTTRDKDFKPLDNVSVTIDITSPGDETLQVRAEAVPDETGLFEAAYVPRTAGGYLARTVVTDSSGIELGRAETGWTTDLLAREFAVIETNRPLLEQIARTTGGRIVEPDELPKFAAELPYGDAPVTTTYVRPLWDLPGIPPALFAFIAICFAAEWLLRRWRQLP